ncbi:MAG: hypothetical protein SVY10_03520, partial [Thermodesulfobacteriota bacterium]|nr:hypothetical protein [Thermodesulfobacteriota bacterium]
MEAQDISHKNTVGFKDGVSFEKSGLPICSCNNRLYFSSSSFSIRSFLPLEKSKAFLVAFFFSSLV